MSGCLAAIQDHSGGFAGLHLARLQDTFYPSCECAKNAEELQQFVSILSLGEQTVFNQ